MATPYGWNAAVPQHGYDYAAYSQYWGAAAYPGFDYSAYPQQQQQQPVPPPQPPADPPSNVQAHSGEINPPLPESPPPPPPGGAPDAPPAPAPPVPPPAPPPGGPAPPPAPPPGAPPQTESKGDPPAAPPAQAPAPAAPAATPPGGYPYNAAPGMYDPHAAAYAGYDPAMYAAYYQQQQQQQAYGGWGQSAWGGYAGQYPSSYPGMQQPQGASGAAGQGVGQGVYPIQPPQQHQPQQQQQPQQHQSLYLNRQPSGGSAAPLPALAASQSYNSVAPPPSLHADASKTGSKFSIRPQMGKHAHAAKLAHQAQPAATVTSMHTAASTAALTASPAYLKVSIPSQSLGQPLAPPPMVRAQPAPAAPAAGAAPRKFPPSFTAWVERCFSKCRTDQDRQAMTGLLSAKTQEVQRAGRMWLMDWDQEPLPALATQGGGMVTTSRERDQQWPREREQGYEEGRGGSLPSPSGRGGRGFGAQRTGSGGSGQWKRGRGYDSPPEDYDRDDSEEGSDEGRGQDQRYGHRGGRGGRFGGRGRGGRHQHQHDAGAMKKRKKGQFQEEEEVDPSTAQLSEAELQKLQGRAGRFGDGRALGGLQSWQRRGPGAAQSAGGRGGGRNWRMADEGSDDEFDLSSMVVIQGTCQQLEKSYFRLTAAPDPSVVRPEAVLRRALQRLVDMMRDGGANWFYACDQFKGMRQDCTVQRLRNSLAVEVYEAHARAALEYGDLAEFNQCQTQLHAMYADKQPGCVAEFTAYKILYETAHATRAGVGRALLHTMRIALADAAVAGSPEVRHALATRHAVMTADYTTFFNLYAEAPHLGRALMDTTAATMRWAALNVMVKSFKTQLPVSFLAVGLGFTPRSKTSQQPAGALMLPGCRAASCTGRAAAESSEEAGLQACVEWLGAHGAAVEQTEQGPQLDVKASVGKLVIPEEPKVSHGDENLSLGDFLSAAAKKSAAVYL